jgi:hypothetical protein
LLILKDKILHNVRSIFLIVEYRGQCWALDLLDRENIYHVDLIARLPSYHQIYLIDYIHKHAFLCFKNSQSCLAYNSKRNSRFFYHIVLHTCLWDIICDQRKVNKGSGRCIYLIRFVWK